MSNSRKASTTPAKKAAPAAKKAAPVKKVMPKTAKVATAVAPIKTIGQLVEDELRARGITAATTVTAVRVETGTRVTISPLVAGIGLEPASNFEAGSISIAQAAKAA